MIRIKLQRCGAFIRSAVGAAFPHLSTLDAGSVLLPHAGLLCADRSALYRRCWVPVQICPHLCVCVCVFTAFCVPSFSFSLYGYVGKRDS